MHPARHYGRCRRGSGSPGAVRVARAALHSWIVIRSSSICVTALFLAAACSPHEEREVVGTLPPGTSPRFAGSLGLVGELARAHDGSVLVAVRRVGSRGRAMLSRRFEVADPLWVDGDGRRDVYFLLDDRDLEPGVKLALDAEMELLARFDPDGLPWTDDQGFVEVRERVRTGAQDLAIDLVRAPDPVVAPSAAQAGQGG